MSKKPINNPSPTEEDEFFSNPVTNNFEHWDIDEAEEDSIPIEYQQSETRRLTLDDVQHPLGLTPEQVGYHISYSCKLILKNPYKQWDDREIKTAILELNSNYIHQLVQFINVFRQVEKLKKIWIAGFSDEEIEVEVNKPIEKQSNLPQQPTSNNRAEFFKELGNLIVKYREFL